MPTDFEAALGEAEEFDRLALRPAIAVKLRDGRQCHQVSQAQATPSARPASSQDSHRSRRACFVCGRLVLFRIRGCPGGFLRLPQASKRALAAVIFGGRPVDMRR